MMDILRDLFGNFIVQVLVGVGLMVMLVGIAQSFRGWPRRRENRSMKEMEMKVLSESQQQIAKLRDEMAQLKSTLVEHSMSLDRNVEHLSRRVQTLEERQQVKRD